MVRTLKILALCALILGFVFASVPAEAVIFAPVPAPSIADCGVVGLVGSTIDIDGNPSGGCKAWFPFHSSGAYLAAGISSLNVGDVVFVKGQICTFCLSSCQAVPLLNAQLSACPPKSKKGG